MASRQVTPVACPACGASFMAPIESIIDGGRDPQLKARFVQGRFNMARCPQCGREGPMIAPLLYHDQEKELALVLMPNELHLHNNDQQKIIGDLTNRLLNSLPPEQRKAYLLSPRVFFSMQSLVNAILEAEGITPEMIERQQARAGLLDTLLRAHDQDTLRQLVKDHEEELDSDFFQILVASAQAAHADGQTDLAQVLLGLRALVTNWSDKARVASAEVDAALGLGEMLTREGLLSRLQEAESDEEFEALVTAGRPLLDYAFFQDLTAQIEGASDDDTSKRLKALRSRILDVTAKQDEEIRARTQRAADLIKDILQADAPQAFVHEHLAEIDDTFFAVLTANVESAEASGRKDIAQALERVGDLVLGILEEKLPPEVRLVNQLLEAAYPDETQKLLEGHRELISQEFIGALGQLILQLEQSGAAEAVNHLKQVISQAEQLVEREVVQK